MCEFLCKATDFMDTCNTGYLEVAPWGSWRPSAEVAPLCQVRAGTRAEKAERCRGKAHRLASETRSLAVWVVEVIALCQRSGVRAPMIHLQEDLHAGMSLLKCVWTQHVAASVSLDQRLLQLESLETRGSGRYPGVSQSSGSQSFGINFGVRTPTPGVGSQRGMAGFRSGGPVRAKADLLADSTRPPGRARPSTAPSTPTRRLLVLN
eukprot:symbB.v1.2.014669.t1/scaffold1075.1/size141427/5